jgi:hypothetical protein
MPSVIFVKVIKAKKLNSASLRMKLINQMHVIARGVLDDYKSTTRTWEHQPKFEKVMALKPNGPELLVGTDDRVYRYVDEGTKPHRIIARNKFALAFKLNYKAKTIPGKLTSRKGGASGRRIFRYMVDHLGFEARGFSKLIQKKWERRFKDRMERTMKEWAKHAQTKP